MKLNGEKLGGFPNLPWCPKSIQWYQERNYWFHLPQYYIADNTCITMHFFYAGGSKAKILIMWLCDYVIMWLCDYVIMWLCDYAIMRLCDYVIMWLCDYAIMWLCDYV